MEVKGFSSTKGFAYKYCDNVDTDVIIPARYLNITDKKELIEHYLWMILT